MTDYTDQPAATDGFETAALEIEAEEPADGFYILDTRIMEIVDGPISREKAMQTMDLARATGDLVLAREVEA